MMHEMRLPSEDGWEMGNGKWMAGSGNWGDDGGTRWNEGPWRVGGGVPASLDGPCAKFRLFCTHAQAAEAPQQRQQTATQLIERISHTHTQSHNHTSLHGPLTPSHHSHSMNNRMHFGRMQTVNEPQKCTHRDWD